jgi:hypothetical protein
MLTRLPGRAPTQGGEAGDTASNFILSTFVKVGCREHILLTFDSQLCIQEIKFF